MCVRAGRACLCAPSSCVCERRARRSCRVQVCTRRAHCGFMSAGAGRGCRMHAPGAHVCARRARRGFVSARAWRARPARPARMSACAARAVPSCLRAPGVRGLHAGRACLRAPCAPWSGFVSARAWLARPARRARMSARAVRAVVSCLCVPGARGLRAGRACLCALRFCPRLVRMFCAVACGGLCLPSPGTRACNSCACL